jgi:hypothetical protein
VWQIFFNPNSAAHQDPGIGTRIGQGDDKSIAVLRVPFAERIGMDEYPNGVAHPILGAQLLRGAADVARHRFAQSGRACTGWPNERDETICFLGGSDLFQNLQLTMKIVESNLTFIGGEIMTSRRIGYIRVSSLDQNRAPARRN